VKSGTGTPAPLAFLALDEYSFMSFRKEYSSASIPSACDFLGRAVHHFRCNGYEPAILVPDGTPVFESDTFLSKVLELRLQCRPQGFSWLRRRVQGLLGIDAACTGSFNPEPVVHLGFDEKVARPLCGQGERSNHKRLDRQSSDRTQSRI
jgi:hypothetical protein